MEVQLFFLLKNALKRAPFWENYAMIELPALSKYCLVKSFFFLYTCFVFMFLGLQNSFMSGVYGACVGFTKQLENSEQLVPLVGLFIGAGEVLGGLILTHSFETKSLETVKLTSRTFPFVFTGIFETLAINASLKSRIKCLQYSSNMKFSFGSQPSVRLL